MIVLEVGAGLGPAAREEHGGGGEEVLRRGDLHDYDMHYMYICIYKRERIDR